MSTVHSYIRVETEYSFANGIRVATNRMRDAYTYVPLSARGCGESVRTLYCARANTMAGKMFQVFLWTSTGAFIGSTGGPVGTGIGAFTGLGIGVCTIL